MRTLVGAAEMTKRGTNEPPMAGVELTIFEFERSWTWNQVPGLKY